MCVEGACYSGMRYCVCVWRGACYSGMRYCVCVCGGGMLQWDEVLCVEGGMLQWDEVLCVCVWRGHATVG